MKRFEGRSEGSQLGVLGFAAIMYFAVSGGPFGTEDAISAAGAMPVLIGIVVLTIIWAIPESMVTAELSTVFPEDSGYVAWCSVAFGPFWGWMNGWLSIINVVINNAAFLLIIVDYVALQFPTLEKGAARIVFLLVVAIVLTALNYLGLELVGWGQVVNMVFVMAPFLVLAVICWRKGNVNNLGKVADKVDWSTYIAVMFWNLNYWSLGANLAGEVKDPAYVFPRALSWAVLAVMLSYLIPIASITAVETNFQDWELGFYGEIAKWVGGNWLKVWIVASAIASQAGLYWSSMSTGSHLTLGMAERGFLPSCFGWRSRFLSPILGTWLQLLPSWALSLLSWDSILNMVNCTFAITVMLGLAAMVTLRISHPDLHRPYKMPGNVWVVMALITPAFALLLWVMLIPFYTKDIGVIICVAASVVSGIILYPLMQNETFRRLVKMSELKPLMLYEKGTLSQHEAVAVKDVEPQHDRDTRRIGELVRDTDALARTPHV